ncbi:MAG: hypothetical protein AAFV86_24120, partial [Pseudomonadota bacterium]
MHLLQAQSGAIADGAEPVDPGQDPADIVVISANDAEIAALADAHARLRAAGGPVASLRPTLRLARLAWLGHPFSVDRYIDRTLGGARLVVARVLGGEAYWPYGIEQCAARLHPAGIAFCALPGDDREDTSLARVSTVGAEDRLALWAYLAEGGPENAEHFLRLAAHLIGEGERPPAAVPLLRAGVYARGMVSASAPAATVPAGTVVAATVPAGTVTAAAPPPGWAQGRPVAALVFYRALLQG